MKKWSEDADEQDCSEGTAERTAGGMTPGGYRKGGLQTSFGRIRTAHKWKKSNGVQRDRRKTEDPPGAGATEASSPEKKATGAKQQDTHTEANDELWDVARLAPRHRTQLADGGRWCDGKKQRAQNETDYFGTWRKGRLLEEATVKAISRR